MTAQPSEENAPLVSAAHPQVTVPLDAELADADAIETLFQTILGRRCDDDAFKREHAGKDTVLNWVRRLIGCEEFAIRFAQQRSIELPSPDFIRDEDFRTPSLAAIKLPNKIFVIGSCMTHLWDHVIEATNPGLRVETLLVNNGSEVEDLPPESVAEAAFAIVQIPLRSLVMESEYLQATVSSTGKDQLSRLLASAIDRLRRNLQAALKFNREHGLPCFVLNFAVTQRNPLGILMPKYDISNFAFFLNEINRALYELIVDEKSVYMIDFDEICSTLGKRYISDEMTAHFNHGSFLSGSRWDDDIDLTPHGSAETLFRPKRNATILAIFNECLSAFQTISATDKVKLVIFDLDGTLWRGVAAEKERVDGTLTEGWPIGIVESAAFLKKRGILLAIASKNDPDMVVKIWNQLYEKRFPLSNFVSRKISWRPKVESIAEILAETNLLPANVLFVDDNPIEREQVKLAYPDMHVIDGPILNWRRTLLWSTETQVPYVTAESANRTASIQSMIQREDLRQGLDHDAYLASLAITIRTDRIAATDAPDFPRAFELLNKTNQFNITGTRFTEQAIEQLFAAGGFLIVGDVSDRLSDYGLTAVIVVRDGACLQFVMSCRVFGLGIEFAMFDRFLSETAGRERTIDYVKTAKNGPVRKFFETIGLSLADTAETGDERRFKLSADHRIPHDLLAHLKIDGSVTPPPD